MAKTLEEINAEFHKRLRQETETDSGAGDESGTGNESSTGNEDGTADDSGAEDDNDTETVNHAIRHTQKISLISDIIFYFTIAAMVLCAVLFSRSGIGRNTIGNYQYFEVLTTSMQSVYPRGSLVMVKSVNTNSLEIGDDITFYKDSSTTITHRIIAVTENYDGNGDRGFVTKGVENAEPDSGIVDERNVVGMVIWHVPYLGALLSWLGENLWLLLVIFGSLLACSFFLRLFCRETAKLFKKEEDKRDKKGRKTKNAGTGIFAKVRTFLKQKQNS